ncbi:MAG: response receiver sensor diguanylate cyclase/phosphodiesterase [Labilithrix sp.]|nr:response receiver sensor diguanylate cyclase/phosphodiesterase [Labilithrix sp.]
MTTFEASTTRHSRDDAGHADDLARSLERAQRLARLVQWRFDPDARTFRWFRGSAVIFRGLEGEGPLWDTLLRWVHPLDRARVEEGFRRGVSHDLEYRLILPDGEERVVHQEAETEVDRQTGRLCIIGTAQDVTQLRAAEDHVRRLAYYDELTALPNRSHACRFLTSAIATAKMRRQRVAVVSLDLDHFRRVNDSLGHVAGNVLLREVGARLHQFGADDAARGNRPEMFVARLGGDEFALIVRDCAGEREGPELFRRLNAQIGTPYAVDGVQVVLSFSAGIATYPASGDDAEALLMRADAAMHVAKDRGRGRSEVFASELGEKLQRRDSVERRLRRALALEQGLEIHYQPKVDVTSRRAVGVEALLRFVPDAIGPIPPNELIAVAEETGTIVELGDWVLRTACRQAKAWSSISALRVPVAVNISARQFNAPDFADKVRQVLAETQLSPDLLELEVTEGVMVEDIETAIGLLEQLKEIGVRVALDDFGTGYSSLAYLTRFPVDTLKIDRSFVAEIGVAPKSEAIVTAIVALSRSLGIDVVAEGVETEAQRAFLEQLGPMSIQGWLFSKALPGPLALAWITAREAATT